MNNTSRPAPRRRARLAAAGPALVGLPSAVPATRSP